MSGASRPGDPDNDDALAGFVDGLDHDTVLSTGAEDQFEARTVLSAPDPALLAMTPPAPQQEEPPVRKSVPKLLEANDIAPGFRAGVKLTRNALGGYEIQDQMTGEAFALNEYEGSLARMLNGQRPISDILEAGRRLGIPINLESLQKFIQHLDGNGFLGNGNEADAKAAWASRGEWETSVRTLFQSGIRLLRQGKHAEAAGYFEALLEEDPNNIEARELLAMANAGPQRPSYPEGSTPPTGLSDTISAVAPYAPVPFGPQPVLLVQAPQPVRPSRFGVIALVTITALVIGGGILASQISGDKPKPAEVVTPPLAIDAAPMAIVIDAPPMAIVIDAAPVAVISVDAATPVAVPIDAGAAVVNTDDKPKPKPIPKPIVPKVEPTKVEAPTAGEVTAFLRAPRNVKKGDKLFEIVHFSGDPAAIKAAAAKVADMEKMAKEDPTTYEAFLADARKELETTRGATSSVVVAPRAGKATPHVKPGADVKAGQLLVVIE